MDNNTFIKEKIKTLSDETISNMLNQRKTNNSSFKDFLIDEQKKRKKHNHLMATNWNYAIKEHIKTGLESPTPYKVIPYKNGIGIKKIEFIKSGKNCCLPVHNSVDPLDQIDHLINRQLLEDKF